MAKVEFLDVINDELKKLLETQPTVLVSKNEKINVCHVAFLKVISDTEIIITDNFLGKTVENIKENPNVILAVCNENWKEVSIGYYIKGVAEYHQNDEIHELVKRFPENEGLPCKGAILVKVTKIKRVEV